MASAWLVPLLLAEVAVADARAKSSFHLLAPTPRSAMRPMSTDRPDITESPFTVDAGHVQLEVDAIASEHDDGQTELWAATTNVRLGLTPAVDLHVIVEPWRELERVTGFGDLTLRAKLNLWGNDGGPTAFGVMPFVRLPTAAEGLGSGYVEGGLILPLALDLPGGFDSATMLQIDETRREDGYGTDLALTGSLGHGVWDGLGGYVELVSSIPLDRPDESELGVNGGLVLQLGDDFALDAGTRVGLTAAAPDWGWFIGGSARR